MNSSCIALFSCQQENKIVFYAVNSPMLSQIQAPVLSFKQISFIQYYFLRNPVPISPLQSLFIYQWRYVPQQSFFFYGLLVKLISEW